MTQFVIPPADISIDDGENMLRAYRFGTETAKHHFCGRCGIHVFVETRLNPGHFRINVGCVEGVAALQLPVDVYDGKALEL